MVWIQSVVGLPRDPDYGASDTSDSAAAGSHRGSSAGASESRNRYACGAAENDAGTDFSTCKARGNAAQSRRMQPPTLLQVPFQSMTPQAPQMTVTPPPPQLSNNSLMELAATVAVRRHT